MSGLSAPAAISCCFTNSDTVDLTRRQDAVQLQALTLCRDLLQPAPQREPLRTVLYLQEHLQAVYGGCGCPADRACQPCRHSTKRSYTQNYLPGRVAC